MQQENKKIVTSILSCKATAELNQSVNQDLLKSDGSLKELLDDRSSQDNSEDCDRGSKSE
jgi:hypothetical protein